MDDTATWTDEERRLAILYIRALRAKRARAKAVPSDAFRALLDEYFDDGK